MRNGKECGKEGHLILEKPRETKQRRRSKRSTNIKRKEEGYDVSGRPRGRYFRVHHYVYEDGKRKSRFCYLGNFEKALEKLKIIQRMAEDDSNFKVEKVHSNIKSWIDDEIKLAEGVDVDNLKTGDEFLIWATIANAKFCIMRNGYVYPKYA
jgi:hypothetical protein